MQKEVNIGTRGSPLALAQAGEVRTRILTAHAGLEADNVHIVPIVTTGDRVQDRALLEIGGKGLFTQEIEQQLLAGDIDLAVHSSKDMPTTLPAGLDFPIFLEREDPRDAFISLTAPNLAALPAGARVGTSSLRRAAQVLRARSDLRIVPFRGNVGTRLKKLKGGEVDATLLALAGLKRLDQADLATDIMSLDPMLPAPAQGAVGIEVRAGDQAVIDLLAPLHHRDTGLCVAAERALLAALDGSCRTPIAALATIDGDTLRLRSRILSPGGDICFERSDEGPATEAVEIGDRAGAALRAEAGADFFTMLEAHMAAVLPERGQ